MSSEARSALNLYECAVSSDNANSTLWIFKEQPWVSRLVVNRSISINTKTAFTNFLQSSFCFEWTSLRCRDKLLVEDDGIEPTTPCLQSRCSPSWANPPFIHPHRLEGMVGLVGLEPTTPALSTQCSNQLSYRPKPVTSNPGFHPSVQRQPSNNR